MPHTPVSFTQTELNLLQHVTLPSDMTIKQLAQKMVEYERIQVRAAEIFATDPTKLERMTHDPETRPPNFVSLDEPGANIRMFGSGDAIRVNELKESLARSDELLNKKCVTFEDHFWAIHDAFLPYLLVNLYMVRDPLRRIRGAYEVYMKCHHELHYQMLCEEAPHRLTEPPAPPPKSEVVLKKRHDGFRHSSTSSTYPTPSGSRRSAASPPTSHLVTPDEAKNLLDFSNLRTLLNSKFQTMGTRDDSASKNTGLNPDSWRVASVDFDLGTYGIVYPDTPDPIILEMEELISLLTQSKRMA